MNWDRAMRDIVLFSLAGGLAGLVIGYVLVATDAASNPFSIAAIGIAGGAAGAITRASTWQKDSGGQRSD